MPNGKIPTIVVTGTGPKDKRELSMVSLDRENEEAAVELAKRLAEQTGRTVTVRNANGQLVGTFGGLQPHEKARAWRRRAGRSCQRKGRPALELERTATGRRAASLKPHRAARLVKARCRLAFLSAGRDGRPGVLGRFRRVFAPLIGGLSDEKNLPVGLSVRSPETTRRPATYRWVSHEPEAI
jgi:hypothetical protein